METATDKHIDGLIIAGGKGTRLSGADKGLLIYKGKPYVAHIQENLKSYVDSVYISCNRNQSTYSAYGVLLEDKELFSIGPLAALLNTFESSDANWLLTAPCDSPLIDRRYPERMLQKLNDHICVAWDGYRNQNLHLVIPRALFSTLPDYLASGSYSVRGWLANLPVTQISFEDCPQLFFNVNTPEDQSGI